MSRSYKGHGWLPIAATFVIVFALMFLVVWHSPAKSQATCIDVGFVKSDLHRRYKQAKITEIMGSEMIQFMLGFNSILPETNIIADRGVVVDNPTTPRVTIVLFNAGCYTGIVFLRKNEFRSLLGEMT